MKRYIKIVCLVFVLANLSACKKFLDIVPDNVATIDNAFTLRSTAKKYLYTCYSYLPFPGSIDNSPSFLRGELWGLGYYKTNSVNFQRDGQNVLEPIFNYWEGRAGGNDLFEGIRDCNIFLENIGKVPDIQREERAQWIAEVKFLKAYYHYFLMKIYGPIPLIRQNLPIDAGIEEVKVRREPVDSGFNYIVSLLDEAIPDLPGLNFNEVARQEYGRVNKSIAMSVKAMVMVTAASPLFNGNTDYANYTDEKYGPLFNQQYAAEKWEKAMISAKEAIDECESIGLRLFKFQSGVGQNLSDSTLTKMSIRGAFASKTINGEIIWAYTGGWALQSALTPRSWDPNNNTPSTAANCGPPIDVLELFYTNHGVPIDEDKQWDYSQRFNLSTAKEADRYYIAKDYVTAKLNFNREPRFYANVGFDGGIWYGQGKYDDKDSWHLETKASQYTSVFTTDVFSPTGTFPKKNIYYENYISSNTYYVTSYQFPFMRLADLYLLYAEAANEFEGPGAKSYQYLDIVRERAGLPTVVDSWTNYSKYPTKYTTKDGLRDIIRRERRVELMFESKGYWDLLRWKTAQQVMSQPVEAWNRDEKTPERYYIPTVLFQRNFKKRDYFVPIREYELQRNKNLLQSPGW